MKPYEIKIEWEGPLRLDDVIKNKVDGGTKKNGWEGEDYGLYQIYGRHILCKKNALLYIGQASDETFSQRFKRHKKWLDIDQDKKDIKIYLGRVYDSKKHTSAGNWKTWKRDINIAEKILIYKYSPHYNGRELANEPDLPFKEIWLRHSGSKKGNRLQAVDKAPRHFHYWK